MIAMMAVAIAVFALGTNLYADEKNEHQRLSREELAEKQARHIAHELAFDDATTQKYVETFKAYQQEVWALGPRQPQKKQEAKTDAETEQAIKEGFAHSQKILDIRKKYYDKYSKFLTPKQIERAYELERKAMRRLAEHHKSEARPKGKGQRSKV